MGNFRLFLCIASGTSLLLSSAPAAAATPLSAKLSGRIILQVEEKGKAWYIDPASQERAYLGRPADAFRIMREKGVGITTADLEKIATAEESRVRNEAFARKLAGKIFLQVQENGEAWYVNPVTLKRHYLGRPHDAFNVMRGVGLGIANKDIDQIPVTTKYADPEQPLPSANASRPGSSGQTGQKGTMSGSYRCWSYNVSGGGGGNCRLFAPIVLKSDGTYSISSEKGTYTVSGDTIVLSESKIRGAGTLLENGMQIRFEYDYNGWHHVITYLKEGGSSTSTTQGNASEIPVQLILQYPAKQSSLGSITTVELVPEGQNVANASYKPTAIAVWDGNTRVTASFHKATNTPKAGQKYTVYTSYGGDAVSVGTLDLTNVKEETTVTIRVGTGETETKAVTKPTGVEIVVQIDLVYPSSDSSLGSIQTVTLVPQGDDPVTAPYKLTALAVWDGNKTVVGSFHKATNQVKTGAVYDVYADWGAFGGYVKSGTLDLKTTTAGPVTKVIQTTISGSSQAGSAPQQGQQQQETTTAPSAPQKTYVDVNLTLQYKVGSQSHHNVTRIALIKPGEEGTLGWAGELAGYGSEEFQLAASFSALEAGHVYDVYTTSYATGNRKVGTLDLTNASGSTTKTVLVE